MRLPENFPDSDTFAALLRARVAKWRPGSFVAEFACVLVAEEKEPARGRQRLEVRNLTSLPTTRRIDGIMPLTLPLTGDIERIVGEFLDECERLVVPLPEAGGFDKLRAEIALCYLAHLHRRKLRLDFGLDMVLELQCPVSSFGTCREEMLLMGRLPFGGNAVLFYSALRGSAWCDEPPPDIRHATGYSARRDGEGRLRLVVRD
jgi:hypothetical protein